MDRHNGGLVIVRTTFSPFPSSMAASLLPCPLADVTACAYKYKEGKRQHLAKHLNATHGDFVKDSHVLVNVLSIMLLALFIVTAASRFGFPIVSTVGPYTTMVANYAQV